jgi:hypothetical protein
VIYVAVSLGLAGVIAPLDPSAWNLVSDAVGCGTGRSQYLPFAASDVYVHRQANDDAQLDCMKSLPYQTLKDAVISNLAYFFLVVDSRFSLATQQVPVDRLSRYHSLFRRGRPCDRWQLPSGSDPCWNDATRRRSFCCWRAGGNSRICVTCPYGDSGRYPGTGKSIVITNPKDPSDVCFTSLDLHVQLARPWRTVYVLVCQHGDMSTKAGSSPFC